MNDPDNIVGGYLLRGDILISGDLFHRQLKKTSNPTNQTSLANPRYYDAILATSSFVGRLPPLIKDSENYIIMAFYSCCMN